MYNVYRKYYNEERTDDNDDVRLMMQYIIVIRYYYCRSYQVILLLPIFALFKQKKYIYDMYSRRQSRFLFRNAH